MKTKILLFLCLCSGISILSNAQNSLTVSNPQWWGDEEIGSIDEAIITVEPKGLYMEVGMYLTVSARDLWRPLEDTLEVVLDFNLPADAIVTDSWLWVNQDIVRGAVIDRWTASAIFEELVDRRTDPSILFKNSVDQYQLRIFPMAGTESRKVKLNFLIPTTWTQEQVSADLPFHILNTTYAPIETFKLLVRGTEDWINPQIKGEPDISFIDITEPGLGQWQLAQFAETPRSLSLGFDAPLQNGVYVSTFQQGNEKLYQTALLPPEFTDVEEVNRVMVLINRSHTHSSLIVQEVVEQVKSQLYEQLGEDDFFNIATFMNSPHLQSPGWLRADSMNIEAAFINLLALMSNDSYVPELLSAGIEFIQAAGEGGEILLVSAGENEGDHFHANAILEDIEVQLDGADIPIHIIDFQDENFGWFWNGNGFFYDRGNHYFFNNLSRLSRGNYYQWRDSRQSIAHHMGLVLQELEQIEWSFDFHPSLENGFCYDSYPITHQGQSTYLNQPILQVGKYFGDFPFHITLSAVVNDTQFIQQSYTVLEEDVQVTDSLSYEIWTGHFIKELEASGTSNNIINQIIAESIEERVLSLYTAYLCLEPGEGGEVCTNCFEDGEEPPIVFSTEVTEAQLFSLEAFPNPFTTETRLQINLGQSLLQENMQIQVYNAMGQLVKNFALQDALFQDQTLTIPWDARNAQGQIVENGTYFFVVRVGDEVKVAKVMFFGR